MAEGSITIKITGDTGNLESKLKKLEAKIKQLGTATDAASDVIESSTDAAASAMNELQSGADAAAKAVDKLATDAGDVSSASKEMGNSVEDAGSAAEAAGDELSDMGEAASSTAENMADTGDSSADAADNIDDLGGASDAAADDIGKLGDSSDKTSDDVEGLGDSSQETSKKEEKLSATTKELTEKITAQEKELNQLKEAYADYALAGDESSEAAQDLAQQIEDLNSELQDNKSKLEAAESAADSLTNNMGNLGNSTNQTSSKFGAFKTMVAGILAADLVKKFVDKSIQALKELAQNVMETGMTFESSISNVAAISGATESELQLLTDTAKEMGMTTQFTAAQAADALSYMALAGWDVQQSVSALPGILTLAAASGMGLASASDLVTDYLSAFGMEASESGYMADILAYAQGNANTTAELLGESYKNVAANMHAAGQDIETTTSFLAMLANQGLKGSEAGTALAAIVRDITAKMENATIAAKSFGDGANLVSDCEMDLTAASKQSFIEIGNGIVAVSDLNGNYRDMTDIIKDVESATNGMGEAEKASALAGTFTADSIKGLNLILNAGADEAAAFEEELRNSTGAAQAMADVMNDNLAGDITLFQSAVDGLYQSIYEKFQPIARITVQTATSMISGITSVLFGGAEKTKVSGERVVLQFVRGLTEGLPDAMEAGAQAVENFLTGTVANIPNLATSAARTVLAWVMYLRLGITSIISAGAEFVTTLAEGIGQHLPEIVQAAVNAITGFVSSLIDNLPQIASTAVAIVSNLASTITQNVPTILAAGVTLILNLLGGIIQSIPSVLEGIATLITNICDKIGSTDWISVGINIITTLASGISGAVSFVGEATMAIVDAIINYFSEHGNDWLEAGKNIILGLKDGIVSLLTEPVDAIRDVCDNVLNAVLDFFGIASPSTVMAEQGMYIDQGLGQGITDNQDSATTPASTMAQAVFDAASGILSTASSIGSGFVSFLSGGISSNSDTASSASKKVASSAASSASGQKSAFSTAGKTVGSAFSSGIQNVKSAVSSAAKFVSTAGHAAASGLKSQYQTAGKTVTTAFKNGITGQRSAVSSAAKTIAAAGHAAANATKSSWLNVGGYLASGLASGISRGASTVISAATSIAKKAISAAKSALGIKSPSRVMRDQIGVMISRGVAVGIIKAEPYVSSAATDLSESVVDNFNPDVSTPVVRAHKKVSRATLDNVRSMLLADNSVAAKNVSTAYTTNNVYNNGGGKIVHIDYHPEQKFDGPVSLRDMDEHNRRSARGMEKVISNA